MSSAAPPRTLGAQLQPGARIALLSESTELGGGERVVGHLGRSLMDRGYHVHLIVPSKVADGWLDNTLRSLGATVHYVPLQSGRVTAAVRSVRDVFVKERIVVANGHMPGMVMVGAVAAAIARVPFLATLHNGDERWTLFKRRIPLGMAIRLSSAANVVSVAMRAEVASRTWISPSRLALVYNGAEKAPSVDTSARAGLGVSPDALLVLCLGSKTINKDHATVVRALAHSRFASSMALVIAGRKGNGSQALTDAIASSAAQVIELEHTDDVASLLDAADIFVLSSHREGLPMVIVEAMLAGKAIVTTDVGGISEVIADRENGLFFKPGDERGLAARLDELCESPDLRSRLGFSASRTAEGGLTIAHMADQYLSLFTAIGASRA